MSNQVSMGSCWKALCREAQAIAGPDVGAVTLVSLLKMPQGEYRPGALRLLAELVGALQAVPLIPRLCSKTSTGLILNNTGSFLALFSELHTPMMTFFLFS